MAEVKIGICKNEKIFSHEGQWTDCFANVCQEKGIPYEFVDCYGNEIIAKAGEYSHLLWNMGNYVYCDILEADNILTVMERQGVKVFPDRNTRWHFDDKIAEMYLLQSVQAPMPKSWVFYDLETCLDWLKNEAKYPLVAKLRCGSGSNNVKLLKSFSEAKKYAQTMFSKGFNPSPSFVYKAYSKAQSAKDWNMIVARIKKIPSFLNTLRHAKQFPNEKAYCYFQEYIENKGYDLKIVVIGDKLSFIARNVRKGDWRASGGGDCYYEKNLITQDIIDSAFRIADEAGFQCMGFDYVVDAKTGKGLIIEMCYGFDHMALYDAGGYFDRAGRWHDAPVDIPREIIERMIEKA